MEMKAALKIEKPQGIVGVSVSGPTAGKRETEFTNTVTEGFMSMLFGANPVNANVNNMMDRVTIGIGTDPITYTSTALGNSVIAAAPEGVATRATIVIDEVTHVGLTVTKTFDPGTLVGDLTEVGLASTSLAGGLIAGTLVKNSEGVPTPINVLADDQITVTYTLAFNLNGANAVEFDSGTVNVNGEDIDFTATNINMFRDEGGTLYVRNPSYEDGGDKDQTLIVNGTASDTGNSTVSHTSTYDAVNRSCEWVYDSVVFATFNNGDISTLGTIIARNTPTSSTETPIVQLAFTPSIPRPVDTKLVFKYRFKISW